MNKDSVAEFNTNLGLLADLYGVEYQSDPDMKVGMLKSMGVLEDTFDHTTTNHVRFLANLIKVKELVRQKKDANFTLELYQTTSPEPSRANSIRKHRFYVI